MNAKFQFLYYVTRDKIEYINFHKHNCYELIYYIKGSGFTTIGDIDHNYSNSTFSIVTPDIYHDEKHSIKTEVLYIGFEYNDSCVILNNGVYFDNLNGTILTLLKIMKKELSIRKPFYNLKLDSLVSELLVEYCRINNLSSSFSRGDLVYVYKYIKENYNQKLDLNTLAELSNYSYHRFRHIFKEQTGMSPVNYIIKARIDKAAEFLVSTNQTISRISDECGFATSSLFCIQFKRVKGYTPTEYRIKLSGII